MSATVSLGWNNADLQAGASRAGSIVKSTANQIQGALNSVKGIDVGRLVGIGLAGYSFSQLASGIAQATLTADDNRQAMLAVEGSIEGVNERLTILREIARSPGLGFSQVVEADVKLRSVGMSAAESGRAIEQVGNALALVGKGKADLDGVLLALTQIVSKGKISAEEINQIAERVPQIRAILKGAFGTADSQALQSLNIPVEEFIRRTIDGFAKLPRAIGGLRNSWENLGDTVSQTAATLGDAVVPELIPFMEDLAGWLDKNGDTARNMGRLLADAGRLSVDTFHQLKGAVDFVAGGFQHFYLDIFDLIGVLDKSMPHFNAQAAATRRLANDQKLAEINAAGLARQQRELEIVTQRAADAERRAAEETDKYNRSLVQAAATRAQALTSLQDQLRAESAKTRDLLIDDDQRLIDAKDKLLTIDKQLNATAGQKGSEETVTKLYIERERTMQAILELQKKIGEQQRRDNEDAARAAQATSESLSTAASSSNARGYNNLVGGTRRQNETREDFRQRMDTGYANRQGAGIPIPTGPSAFDRLQGGTSAFDRLQSSTSAFDRLQSGTSAFDRLQQSRSKDPIMPVPAANATAPENAPRDLINIIQTLPEGIARALGIE